MDRTPLERVRRVATDSGAQSSSSAPDRRLERRTNTMDPALGSSQRRKPIPRPAAHPTSGHPKCEVVRFKLHLIRLPITYSHRHRDGPSHIFPVEAVKGVLSTEAKLAFYCECQKCNMYSQKESSSRNFDESSLLGEFATTFALLIYYYRAGLIRYLQKHNTMLPFTFEKLAFISDLHLPDDSSDLVIREIVESQYQFYMRNFNVQHYPVSLESQEALPIVEAPLEEGHGVYGTVFSFRFLPGYVGQRLYGR